MIYPSVIFAVENTSVPFIIIFLLKDGGHKERKNTNMLLSLGPKDLGDALKAAMAEPGPSGYGVGPTSSQLPGGVAGAAPAGASPATGAMQTPEEAT